MIRLAYDSVPAGFRAILISFLSFFSQKTYPVKIFRPEVVLSRSYLKKCSVWLGSPPIINFSFLRNAIKSEPFGVRG